MEFTKRNLTGKAYLAAATDLLQRIRLEGARESLYEAADIQWWWRKNDASISDRQIFWLDTLGRTVACLIRNDAGNEWSNDFFYLPSLKQPIYEHVIPEVIAAISNADKVSTIAVREDDIDFRRALEDAGFVKNADTLVQAELVTVPARTQLPPGFYLTTRAEDQRPHHMIRRNGEEIALKLSECSLYRPELDLCVRDASGNVAAYVLFWMDDVTKVGLIEPVRTEAEFQRRGLARHLLAAGITRLRALGAELIRVNHDPANEAAANLYHRSGFADSFKMPMYSRNPS